MKHLKIFYIKLQNIKNKIDAFLCKIYVKKQRKNIEVGGEYSTII